MNIPFFGLDRQYKRYREDFIDIADKIYSTGKVLQGQAVTDMEKTLCELCNRKYAVALGSGTDALAFALTAAGIGPGDEVLITSFSFFASVSPILRVGATPRFVDIEPDYYMMNPRLLDGLVTKATKAILAVHLYGQTLPIDQIEGVARRHKLVLIEDAAQALGSKDGNRSAGNMGGISCLSFDPTKVIGSFSSAGALVTDDSRVCEMVQALRYHGRNPTSRRYEILGFNSQLSTEMAAMLDFKLARLEEWIEERDHIAQIYLSGLAAVSQVDLPKLRPGSAHNWHKFVLRAEDRDRLAQHLKDRGIETMIHYPKALCDEPLIQELNLPPEAMNVPVARKAALNVISLPIYPELTEAEASYVVGSIKGFYDA